MADRDEQGVRYLDRASGEWRRERVFGERELRWFYGSRLGRLATWAVFSRAPFSKLYGGLKRAARSRAAIPEFVAGLGIDASEAARPLEDYASLDDFFARHLRAGARPLDPDPDALLSPADGRVLAYEAVGAHETLRIKASRVTPAALLGDEALARRFAGGPLLIVRLAPADYHRFHFPADGTAGAPRRLHGPLHSVHPIALEGGAPSFLNEREVTLLESPRHGLLALVEVGAMVVGTIEQTYAPGPVRRGAEKGTFHFGGSTVVLLTEPGRVALDEDLLDTTRAGYETLVRMGTRVGRAREATCSAS
ncbi:MAG: phosphatidylserine decarboxylase [Planctomycetota bacterium]